MAGVLGRKGSGENVSQWCNLLEGCPLSDAGIQTIRDVIEEWQARGRELRIVIGADIVATCSNACAHRDFGVELCVTG